MRPITLKLSGLQSYRELQCVDFVKLGETGVFGIFGPTGAGKSSILDAITLALYGKVERAQNRTIGIMNNCERTLTVSFTFDLGAGGERVRYRVERRYKRVDDRSISSSYSRLFAVNGDEEIPLADRDTDVTNRIREIIGLTVDDFTRAVVLPQGRFAEFLTLKGTDRTQMLQRLFSLETYGQLSDKAKTKLSEAEAQLSVVVGEQTGLGDCSDEALEAAKREYAESIRQVEIDRSFLNKVKADFDEKSKLWGWTEELERLSQKEADHYGLSAAMDASARELEEAEAAEPVRNLLISQRDFALRLQEAEKSLVDAQAAYDEALSAKTEADTAWESAVARREREQPVLFEQKASMEQVISEFDRLKDQEEALKDLYGKREGLRQEYRDTTELLRKAEDEFRSLESEIKAIKEQNDQFEVNPEYRRKITDSHARLEGVRVLESQAEESQRSFDENASELERLQSELAEVRRAEARILERHRYLEGLLSEHMGRKPGDSDELRSMALAVEKRKAAVREAIRLGEEICRHDRRLDELKSELRSAEEMLAADEGLLKQYEEQFETDKSVAARCKLEMERIIAKGTLAAIAEGLVDGLPCPLCGSVHHPMPVRAATGEMLEKARAEAAEAEERLARTQNLLGETRTRAAKSKNSAEHIGRQLAELEGVRDPLIRQLEHLRQILPTAWRCASSDELLLHMKNEEDDLAARQNSITEWQSKEKDLTGELQASALELTDLRLAISGLEGKAESCSRSLEQAQGRLTEVKRLLSKSVAEFDCLRGDIDRELIPVLFGELRKREEISSDLQQQMKKKQDLIEKAEPKFRELDEARSRLKETGAGLTALIEEREKQIKSVRDTLESRTGGADAGYLLKQVETALSELNGQLQAAHRNRETASENLQRTSAAVASAGARYESCRKICDQTGENLKAELNKLGFSSSDEAVGRLRDGEARRKLREKIQTYREYGKGLQAERERLEGLLEGRTLTADEWDEAKKLCSEADRRLQDSLTKLGSTQMNLSSLEGKRARWSELEESKGSIEERRLQLNRLSSLLRGNSFVQFVSEEQMTAVVDEASSRLMGLTGQRYSLELEAGGDFSIRDNFNGGTKRAVGTLSGGETFLTSLSLAIALSTQIQLRGRCPLEFFFLDEGFGTLDPELLETVMSALERLHMNRMLIGIISHVPELRARMARRLVVEPAQASGRGSRLILELG